MIDLKKFCASESEPRLKDLPLPEHRGWQWIDTAIFRKQLPQDAAPADWNKLYTADQLRARDIEVWNLAMEEAAKEFDGVCTLDGFEIGKLLRALKEQQ